MCDMLAHFFFANFEANLTASLKERLEVFSRPKPGLQTGQNKKQIIDLNLPSKLKKSLQRMVNICFEEMKEDKEAWLSFPEARAVYKSYPDILNYKSKSQRIDVLRDLNPDEAQKMDNHTEMIRDLFKKTAGVDEMLISDSVLEIIYQKILKSKESKQQVFFEYIELSGDKVEIERMKSYFSSILGLKQTLDRSDCYRERSLADSKLNQNGITILLNMLMYFNDQENTGKFLVDGINLAGETSEKLKNIAIELYSYEEIGILSLCCSGLMESPLWFFYSQINLIKLFTEQFTMYQNLSVARQFSKESLERMKLCPELNDFYCSDLKATTLILASLDQFFSDFKRYQLPKAQPASKSEHTEMSMMEEGTFNQADSHTSDKALFETVVVSELYEYLLINIIMRYEGSQFDLNIVDLVEASRESCQQTYKDVKNYILACLTMIKPEYRELVKDSMSATQEKHHNPYKKACRELMSDINHMARRLHENFNLVFENQQVYSYRIDYLALMYQKKLGTQQISLERAENIMARFGRLDAAISKSDKDGSRSILNHIYLNAFQVTSNYHVHEVELLRNEVFLQETLKCLSSLMALLTSDCQRKVVNNFGESIVKEVVLEKTTRKEPVDITETGIRNYLALVTSITDKLKELIDVNPVALEKFSNFGIDHEKLFTFGNFVQTLIDSSRDTSALDYSHTFRSSIKPSSSRRSTSNQSSIDMTVSTLIDSMFKVIMKALHTLYVNYEKHKYKAKENHHFLKTAVILKTYVDLFFGNARSRQMCDRFAEYLCEEYFTKCIDVIYKQETDLRLSYVLNNPMYKNNLRCSYFDFLSQQELQNIRTFKKIERLAFKENNPLYLVMAFKSMECNLQDVFRKFSAASIRELGVIQAEDFGKDLDAVSRLVNDSEEYGFFTSDKKHYDVKIQKALMSFAKTTPKTFVFEHISAYINVIYSAICQCYTYCKAKKSKLARMFEESNIGNVEPEPEVISLLEEKPEGNENTIAHLNKLINSLSTVHEMAELFPICSAFKSEYIDEFSTVLLKALSQSDTSTTAGSNFVHPGLDATGTKLKKKGQPQTIDLEETS